MGGGLWVSSSGMSARVAEIDVIAEDVANVDTPAFRQLLPTLSDAPAQPAYAGSTVAGAVLAGAPAALPVLIGGGVSPGPTTVDTTEGPIQQTGRPLDLAIAGPGMFTVGLPGGGIAYTRTGRFGIDASGVVTDASGRPLLDLTGRPITLPQGATALTVRPDGAVEATVGGQQRLVATIALSVPANAEGMVQSGDGLLTATPAAGAIAQAVPGAGGSGTLASGVLEGSNVDLAVLLPELIAAQRAYEVNSRAFSVSLQMWATANQSMQ